MGSDGQELSRLVGDCGATISWHNEKRSLDHQLFHMVRRKIWASEAKSNIHLSNDPIEQYLPETVAGIELDKFILDQSFYKPRDLILRLKAAQDQNPLSRNFSSPLLAQTEKEYSSRMWEEVVYELSASYTPHEVRAIEALFIGNRAFFTLDEIATRLREAAPTNKSVDDILYKRGVSQLLRDLYRVGAIGNYYTDESSGKQRWIFRGDQFLEESKRMGIHPAFIKRLAVVRPQKYEQLTE